MTNCPECGLEMLQLQGWDFLKCICFNPVHKEPLVYQQTWCCDPKITHRQLSHHEQEIIDKRKEALTKRLSVVQSNWELMSVINCFRSGGWTPEIDERITKVKGEHL